MRQKYCSIPQKGNAFWRLVQGMELTEEQKSLFKSCRIKHVEVSLKSNSWEILLQTNELMPSELLASAADYIAQKCKINGVTFYQDVIDLEASIEKSWKKLVEVAANGNHTVFHLLKQAKRVVDGSHLTIEVGGELGGEILRAHSVAQVMHQALHQLLGFVCDVECKAVDEAYDIPDEDRDSFMTREYMEALQAEQRRENAAASPAGGAASGSGTGHQAPAPIAHGPLIFGKSIMGEVMKTAEADGETKNVIFEGSLGRTDVREFKTGTMLLLFDLADDTNGLSCKKFFKEKEKEEFV